MSDHIKQNQNVHFSVVTHHPSGGYVSVADANPYYLVQKKNGGTITNVLSGTMAVDSMWSGKYNGYFYTSGNLFDNGSYYELSVSGMVAGVCDVISVKSFVVGEKYYSDVRQVSGQDINYNDFGANTYFANIKYNKDVINSIDEYSVNWFKNGSPLSSGNITNPAISLYRTSDGVSLFSNQRLNYASVNLGVTRYNEGTNVTVSGESYLAVTSSTIDGSTRRWEQIIGIDSL